MAEVELRGVSKTFPNGFQALHDLSLTVADGEFLVLVGPSGCGKSTALNIVAGLEACTTGDVRVGDRVVTHEPPKRRDVAMVFQDYALYPHMTVARNIGFPLELAKVSKSEIRTRVAEAARILDLQAQLGKKPGQLSGGQKQRVAMGRAIVRRPSVFLMDEPLSNLDAKLRVQMRTEIARLQAELEVTTLYVTHDQVEAMTMGDRVAVMLDGRLQQLDTPKSLYANPRNLFVAGFIGSPAMNLVRARVERTDDADGIQFAAGSQSLPVGAAGLGRFGGAEPLLARGEVAIGIRPEHLKLAEGGLSSPLKGTVALIEELGADLLAHIRIDAIPVQIVDTVAGEAAREELAPSAIDRDTAVIVARLAADAEVRRGRPWTSTSMSAASTCSTWRRPSRSTGGPGEGRIVIWTAMIAAAVVAPPPVDEQFDYQIGGDYEPAAGVTVVSRDWFDGEPLAATTTPTRSATSTPSRPRTTRTASTVPTSAPTGLPSSFCSSWATIPTGEASTSSTSARRRTVRLPWLTCSRWSTRARRRVLQPSSSTTSTRGHGSTTPISRGTCRSVRPKRWRTPSC